MVTKLSYEKLLKRVQILEKAEDERLQAITKLREKAQTVMSIDDGHGVIVPHKIEKLLNDLHVYQVELEIQNQELRDSQDQLKQSRDRFSTLYHMSPVGYIVLNQSGMILDANHSFAGMLNRDRHDLLNRPFAELINRNDHNYFYSKYRTFFSAPENKSIELKIVRKDNSMIHVSIEGSHLSPNNAKPDLFSNQLLATVHDITLRQQAEDALKKAKETLQSTLDGLSANIALLDEYGTILLVNSSWRKFAEDNGLSSNEVSEGKNYFNVCRNAKGEDADEAVPFSEGIRAVISRKIARYELEYPCHSPVEERWFVGRVTPFPEGGLRRVVISHENITRRKKAENALYDQNALLDSTGRIANIGGWKLDTRSQTVLWTKETYRIHDVPLDYEIELENAIHFYHPDDRKEVSDAVHRALQEGRPYDLTVRFITAKGNHLWVRTIGQPVMQSGEVIELRGTFQDITERKRLEDSFEHAQHMAKIGRWKLDIPNEKLEWSLGVYNIFELDPNEFSASYDGFLNAIHPDDRDRVNQAYTHSLQTRQPYEIHHRLVMKDGRIKYVKETCQSEFSMNGVPLLSIGFIQDITDRIEAEQALKKAQKNLERRVEERTGELAAEKDRLQASEQRLAVSEERLKLVMDSVRDAVWDWRLDTGQVYFSSRWYTMLGYDPGEMPPSYETWESLLHSEDVNWAKNKIEHHIKSGTPFQMELRMRTRDGGWKWILARGKAIETDDTGTPVRMLGTHTDITHQKQMEAKLQQSQKLESIGTLAGGIAHDFNNILSSIYGYTELARSETSNPEKLRGYLDQIMKGGERAKDLVQHILTFSRKKEKEMKPLQPSLVIKEAIKLLRSSIPTTIDIEQKITTEAYILADPTQIHQIVMNLCTNAYHAMRDTGGILGITLQEVESSEVETISKHDLTSGRFLQLIISDTGKGMDEKTKTKIFEPYFTTKKQGEGTGLGLAVVHGIVKSHGGSIDVWSDSGQGSTFYVYLPVYENEVENVITKQQEIILRGNNETILMVDDEPEIVDIIGAHLKSHGYRVYEFTNAVEAFQEFQQQPKKYDLVLTDMTMPFMTGSALAQKMMDIRPDLPIILLTGHSDLVNREKAMAMGINTYLEKPINKKMLLSAVSRLLDQTKLQTLRVLFVEDEMFNAVLGKSILEQKGCNVVLATSGEEAIDLFRHTPDKFDIIITDQNMQKLTGLDLAEQALAIRPDISILIVTGDEDLLDEKRVKSIAVSEIIAKPLEPDALFNTIRRVLHNR